MIISIQIFEWLLKFFPMLIPMKKIISWGESSPREYLTFCVLKNSIFTN